MLVEMPTDVLVHPDERGPAAAGRVTQGLEYERGDVEVPGAAAVDDLLHPHAALAGRAPRLVGFRLLAPRFLEVRRLGAGGNRRERSERDDDGKSMGPSHAGHSIANMTADWGLPTADYGGGVWRSAALAYARVSQSLNWCAASAGVRP